MTLRGGSQPLDLVEGAWASFLGGQHRSTDHPYELWAIAERAATPKRLNERDLGPGGGTSAAPLPILIGHCKIFVRKSIPILNACCLRNEIRAAKAIRPRGE